MPASQWETRFFASTRGQVITLLRHGERTVDDLALALELTDNAVRSHLTALERDGLVRQTGVRRGGGKPAYTYELTAAGEVPSTRLGGRIVIPREAFETWLSSKSDEALERVR